ncbi:MAG: RNA polymerase sigma factor [Planctomycetaceae bacterium]|nr:RNA polymerase sigma factor [Planctomycetaceae bacterium]MCA9086753.1 RNA polymerase sigma factor [Planctomycetaceae bacterium]
MADEPLDQSEDLDAVYRRHSRELWAIFYSQCSDRERSYDAVQECFLRLHAYQGEPIRDVRAWLLRVGQNWLRDVARRKSSKPTATLDEMPNQQLSPEHFLSSDENRDSIRQCLQQMLEDDRKVLVMKYALDWSSVQMSKVLDCSPAAVDMRLSRARRRLAELLEEQGYSHE